MSGVKTRASDARAYIEPSGYHGRCMFSKRTDWKLTPNRFTAVQREVRASGREVLDLTVSNPTRAGLRYDAESILKSLSNREAMDYDPQPKGLASAREAVAAYYREQCEIEIDPGIAHSHDQHQRGLLLRFSAAVQSR